MEVTYPYVLLVEDDADDELFTTRVYRSTGLPNPLRIARVVGDIEREIGNGECALALIDSKIPGATGLEILKIIRANPTTATAPVVFFTSSDDPSTVQQAFVHGANSYLKKPTDMDEYRASLADAFDFWLRKNLFPRRTQTPSR